MNRTTRPTVVLHVGTPKSGTTFLQRALWANREGLASAGFHLPGESQREMFQAAIEVREGFEYWGHPQAEIGGTWARLCAAARTTPGVTIMSHELLGAADDEQVARALAELDGIDLHVVLTVRDLARAATSEWQERVKNGNHRSFRVFEKRMVRQIEAGNFASGFWRNQDPVGVLGRWAGGVPRENVHVVVGPRPGADPGELWFRFAEAVGFDAAAHPPAGSGGAANQTLGRAQVAALRRINKALAGRIRHPEYGRVVKNQFAERLLASQRSPRPECPPRLARRLRKIARQRNEELRTLGYRVHGDLEELMPPPVRRDDATMHPDRVGDREIAAALAEVVAAMLVQRAQDRRRRAAAPIPASSLVSVAGLRERVDRVGGRLATRVRDRVNRRR